MVKARATYIELELTRVLAMTRAQQYLQFKPCQITDLFNFG